MSYLIHKIRERANLSSGTLFHFTKSDSILKSILKDGFKTKRVFEKLPKNKIFYSAHMVCFCDIPLGLVKHHLKWYGRYGIGLKAEFLKSNSVSPVTYIHSKTKHLSVTKKNLEGNPITPYLKQVYGYVFAHTEGEENKPPAKKGKKFYDEREWRFINSNEEIRISDYDTIYDLEKWSSNEQDLKDAFLVSNLDDIEYIIVRDEKDIDGLIQFFPELKSRKRYNRERLISKIITSKQIEKDF